MLGGLERGMREGTEGTREITICSLSKRDHTPHIYIVTHKNKWYIILDPGYEYGDIHIYEEKTSIPVEEVKKEVREFTKQRYGYPLEISDRRELLHYFIKKRFGTESYHEYTLALGCSTYEVPREEAEIILRRLEMLGRRKR